MISPTGSLIKAQRLGGRLPRKGFSLLELLIVLVIIGALTSIATVSMSSLGADPAEKALKKLRFSVELLSNEAIIRSEVLALGFFDKGYAFFRMNEDDNTWQLVENDRLLKPYEFKFPMQAKVFADRSELLLSGREFVEPQIFVLPTGEMTPFEYQLTTLESGDVLNTQFDALGRVVNDDKPDKAKHEQPG